VPKDPKATQTPPIVAPVASAAPAPAEN